MCFSSGLQDLRINSKAGKVGGAIVKAKGVGIFRDYSERLEWAKMGGKASMKAGKLEYEETGKKNFYCWSTVAGRKERSSLGGKNGAFSVNYIMKTHNCSEKTAIEILKEEQSIRGTIGGKGNKGFIWITDGIKTFKYTKNIKMKNTLTFF
jgi:hypothetical protein